MGIMYEVPTEMASSGVESVESLTEIHQLFRDISLKFSPAESEDVVQCVQRIYGEQFKSLGKQDLMSCLGRLYEFGYVTDTRLTLIKEFIATKSSNENDINERIEDFETFRPPQSELEKILGERSDEITKIMEILENRQKPIVNLYGFAGVGKSTVAKAICGKWTGQTYVVDLKEAENMRAVCLNIMTTLGLPVFFDTERIILASPENGFSAGMDYEQDVFNVRKAKDTRKVRPNFMDSLDLTTPDGSRARNSIVKRIFGQIEKESKDHSILLVLDNFEDSTVGKQKKVKDLHVNLEPQLIDFLGELSRYESKAVTLHVLLTSRTQLRDSKVTNYELQFLKNSLLEEIFLSDVDLQQRKRLLEICKGNPLLRVGTAAILKQKRKSPSDLIDVIEKSCQGEAEIPVKSKGEEDMEEKPFNSEEEEGIDKEQASLIKEMFYTLPSDTLRVSAVSVSLFQGPFTASSAAKILDVSTSEVVVQLEGLVTNGIIQVADKDAKHLEYDIHPLLRKYAESIKNDDMFRDSYTEAKGRFYEHFMSKMKQIAGLMKTSDIKAFNEFQRDRPNFEFAVDISLLPEYFSVPGGYNEITLIVSLFNAVLAEKKKIEVFHSWAEMCPNDGKLGSFFRAQLQCWQARLVSKSQGAREALEVLQRASMSLHQVDDKSTESFKLTQGLYLYFEGEIYFQYRDYQKAIESLESSLDIMEGELKLDTNLARCYNTLGNCYYGLGRPEKALEFYNNALKMREELSGCDYHYDMAVYRNQIGIVHEDKGEFKEAVECYKDALELLKELRCLGNEDEALFRRNLANVYVRQEKYKEAEEEAKKAYKIRLEILGNHPDTVRSIFQLGVIQANLKAFDKALDLFLEAWEREKLLSAGNHSAVWRHIIKGVFNMHEFLKMKGAEKEKEEFRQDALVFCDDFWKKEKEKAYPQFNFTPYNKEIIDAILYLLEKRPSKFGLTDKKEKALTDKYEREALWFYDGMQGITEESFNTEFDGATDIKVLNELLRERTAILNKLIELCNRHDEHEKLLKHKQGKMTLLKKFLCRSDFVGEKTQEKLTLKKAVEELYRDLGEEKSIKKFQENLLATWRMQWEEGKNKEDSREKMLASWRIINGILKLCTELEMKDLRKRYGKEALSFCDRLLEIRHNEMENVEIMSLLKGMKKFAWLIGDRKRRNAIHDALQDLREKEQPRATLKLKEEKPLFEPPILHLDAGEEKDTTKIEAEANVEVVRALGTEVGLQGVITEGSESAGVAVEEGKGAGSHGGSDEQVAVESAKNETETESEDEAEEEKEDVEVQEQVAELAGVEAIGEGVLEGSEEESDDETETYGDDSEGQNVTEEESGGIVKSEGINWAIEQLGVHLMFPPDALSQPTPIMVQRWKHSVCSPPLQEHEAIASNVIKLSSMDSQGVKFNTKVKLSLSHSATNLRGYELVIKQLTDKETNKWEDLDGTKDIRSLEEIEDDFPSHVEIPDFFFPVAQADITECSTYTVVCRLKVSPTYSITSKGGSFSHPDYPGVTVTIPENAVAPNAEFPLELKVQEVSNEEFKEEGVFLGPVLRINCSQGVQFLKPVTIRLPISLREQQDLNLSPICGSTCDVKVLFLNSDDKQKTWIDITDDLVNPPSLDGKFVSFEVERFSRYSHFVKRRNKISRFHRERVIKKLNSSTSVQPRLAVLFAYFRPDLSTILRVMCCPSHLKGQQIKKLEREGIRRPIYSNSKEDMTPGYDKAFVLVSGGIYPHEEEDMGGIYLRFLEHDPDDAELEVDFFPGENVARVKFYDTLKHREPPLCRLHLKTPAQGTDYSDFEERCRQPNVKKGIPTDDELEDLSEKIPDHWKKLGRRLTFDKAELEAFDKDNDKIVDKAYAMLMVWKQREGSAATYRVLNKALCHIRVKRRDLAQRFCCN